MATSQEQTLGTSAPAITRDPRFRAGCKLVRSGRVNAGAIDMFATVLEATLGKYGDASIESAPAYHEYGHALLRAGLLEQEAQEDGGDDENQQEHEEDDDQKPAAKQESNDEHLGTNKADREGHDDDKQDESNDSGKSPSRADNDNTADQEREDDDNDDDNDDDDGDDSNDEADGDIHLALEMMENAYAIMDAHVSTKARQKYHDWTTEQIPRVLLHIGDALAALGRHADAADTYTRLLAYREAAVEELEQAKSAAPATAGGDNGGSSSSEPALEAYRKLVDANVMVAEALVACPDDKDVVTTETKACLVKAAERMDYIRGYYQKAQDAMQTTCFIMADLAARSHGVSKDLKENVCFSSVGLMAIGERIAEYEQMQVENQQVESTEPVKKKSKRS